MTLKSITVIYTEIWTKHISWSRVLRLRVVRVMTMESAVLQGVMPCILVYRHGCFGDIECLSLRNNYIWYNAWRDNEY